MISPDSLVVGVAGVRSTQARFVGPPQGVACASVRAVVLFTFLLVSWAPSATGFVADAVVVILSQLKAARHIGEHCSLGRVGGLGPSCYFERNPALLVITGPCVFKSAGMP